LYIMSYIYDESFAIKDVKARMVLDSRGNPTVQVKTVTEGLGLGIASALAARRQELMKRWRYVMGGKSLKARGFQEPLKMLTR